ncbi:hypothetical protein SPONN_220 [uncultured Candidatus Thioglobus sp.]|nr:hypothetical protein SPONN_220 [uncultured Candidatus Thioglobus sp.]
MLHLRYDSLKRMSDPVKKASLQVEIDLLRHLECTDKSHVPQYLQYRDRGNMHFPKECFIPFFKAVDQCVCEHANEDSLKKHGSKLVEAAFKKLRSCPELEVQFKSIVGNTFETEVVKNVYLELTRKLCNTRIQEFLDVHRQKAASVGGSSTMAGQNLRDTLLTYHINPKALM